MSVLGLFDAIVEGPTIDMVPGASVSVGAREACSKDIWPGTWLEHLQKSDPCSFISAV